MKHIFLICVIGEYGGRLHFIYTFNVVYIRDLQHIGTVNSKILDLKALNP